MLNSCQVYIERGDEYLMLHRVKKENDINKDKWIGVGGKFEEGESPEDCMLREVREETGLRLKSWRYRGIVTFVLEGYGTEYMHVFTSDDFLGQPGPCDEGVLEWVKKSAVPALPIWEGDKIFLRLLAEEAPFFSLKLCYQGDRLLSAALNGQAISTTV